MRAREEAQTAQLKIRIKEPLRAAIERDAARRGVTMNVAINDRLEKSFSDEDRIGGPHSVNFFRTLEAKVMALVQPGFDWATDSAIRNFVINKFPEIVEELRPEYLSEKAKEDIRRGYEARDVAQNSNSTEKEKKLAISLLYILATDLTLPLSIQEEFTQVLPPGMRETVQLSRSPLSGAMRRHSAEA
jgi:hypothetical protein